MRRVDVLRFLSEGESQIDIGYAIRPPSGEVVAVIPVEDIQPQVGVIAASERPSRLVGRTPTEAGCLGKGGQRDLAILPDEMMLGEAFLTVGREGIWGNGPKEEEAGIGGKAKARHDQCGETEVCAEGRHRLLVEDGLLPNGLELSRAAARAPPLVYDLSDGWQV